MNAFGRERQGGVRTIRKKRKVAIKVLKGDESLTRGVRIRRPQKILLVFICSGNFDEFSGALLGNRNINRCRIYTVTRK